MMTTAASEVQVPLEGFVGEALRQLGEAVVQVEQCEPRRGIARIDPARTVEVAEKMLAMDGACLATATGIEVRDGIDVLYHWCIEPAGVVITLRALAVRPELALDSIANTVPTAN